MAENIFAGIHSAGVASACSCKQRWKTRYFSVFLHEKKFKRLVSKKNYNFHMKSECMIMNQTSICFNCWWWRNDKFIA